MPDPMTQEDPILRMRAALELGRQPGAMERAHQAEDQAQRMQGLPHLRAYAEAREKPLRQPEIQRWIAERPERAAFLADPHRAGAVARFTRMVEQSNIDARVAAGLDIDRRGFWQQVADAYEMGSVETELNYQYGMRALTGAYDADRIYALEDRLRFIPPTDITTWASFPAQHVPQYMSYAGGALKGGAAGAVVGAGGGAIVGSGAGGVGALPGAIIGGKIGFGYGAKSGLITRMGVLATGSVNREMRSWRDADGLTMEPWMANLASIPIGVAVTALNKLALDRWAGAIAGTALKGKSIQAVTQAVIAKAASDRTLMHHLARGSYELGRASFNEFLTEIAQEGTQMVGVHLTAKLHEAMGGDALDHQMADGQLIKPEETALISRLIDAGIAGFQVSFVLGFLPMAGRSMLARNAALRNASFRVDAVAQAKAAADMVGDTPEAMSGLLRQSGITFALADATALADSGLLTNEALTQALEQSVRGGVKALQAAAENGSDIRVDVATLLSQVPADQHAGLMPYLSQDPVAVRYQSTIDKARQQREAEGQSPERQAVLTEMGRLNAELKAFGRDAESRAAYLLLLDRMATGLGMKSGKGAAEHLRTVSFGRMEAQPAAVTPAAVAAQTQPAAAKAVEIKPKRDALPLQRTIGEGPEGPDILNAMAEQGQLRRPGPRQRGGEWDAIREGTTTLKGNHARLIAKRGEGGLDPDQMAAALQSQGIGDGTPQTMWSLVDEALSRRNESRQADPDATIDLGEAEAQGLIDPEVDSISSEAIQDAMPEALQDLYVQALESGNDDLAWSLRLEAEQMGIDLDGLIHEATDGDEPFTLFQPSRTELNRQLRQSWRAEPAPAAALPDSGPRSALAFFDAELAGQQIDTPVGTVAVERRHFFALVSGRRSGAETKGMVQGYDSADAALAGIADGEVEAADIQGYRSGSAKRLPLLRDILERPHFVQQAPNGYMVFWKRYEGDGNRALLSVAAKPDADAMRPASFYPTDISVAPLAQSENKWTAPGYEAVLKMVPPDQGPAPEGIADSTATRAMDAASREYPTPDPTTLQQGPARGFTYDQDHRRARLDGDADAPRGQIRFMPDRAIIELTSRSDLSTVPHEVSHWYVHELRRIATEEGAGQQAVEHWSEIKRWLGAESDDLTVAQHEQFARGFEAYLMEGKAPAPELVGAFQKMRRWFMSIYKRASALGVEMSDTARTVFDHMLATDEEAQAMGRLYALTDMDADHAQAMGLSQQDHQRYQQLMEQAIEEAADRAMDLMSTDLRKRVEGWRKQGREALAKSPVHAAMREIRAFGKIDANRAKGLLNKRLYRALRNRNLLSKLTERGMPVEHIVKAHGFADLMALAQAVAEAPAEQDFVRQFVAQAREADPAAGALEAALLESPAFAEAQQLSGQYLSRALGGKPSDAQFAHDRAQNKAKARKSFASMQAGHARTPGHFLNAMARAMREEREAAVRGDWARAERARRHGAMQKEMAHLAVRFRDELHRLESRVKRWAKAKLGTREEQHLSWLHHLLRKYDLSDRVPAVDSAKLEPFRDPETGETLFPDARKLMPDWIKNPAAEAIDWRDLTTERLRELSETLEAIDGQGRSLVDEQLWIAQGTVEQAATGIASQMYGMKAAWVADRAKWAGRMLSKLRSGLGEIRQMVWLFRAMDGNMNIRGDQASGAAEALFIDTLQGRRSLELELRQDVTGRVRPGLDALRSWADSQPAQLEGLPMPPRLASLENPRGVYTAWSPDQIIALALNMGNEYNQMAVKIGYALSDADLRQILSVLGDPEWDAIQQVWDGINSLWPQLDAQHYRLNFWHQKKVEAAEFVTPTGKVLRGGYYPVQFDADLDTATDQRSEFDAMLSGNHLYPSVAARAGMMEGRTATGGKPVLLNLSGLVKHLDNSIRYIAYADVIKDLHRISRHGEFTAAMAHAFGGEAHPTIRPWLAAIVRPQTEIRGYLDRSVEWFRQRVTPYLLAYNLGPVTMQPTSLYQSMQDLGSAPVLKAAAYVTANPVRAISEARAQSAVLRDRMGGYDRDLRRGIMGLQVEARGQLGRMLDSARDVGFVPLMAVDQVAATITWHAAHDLALSQGADPSQALIRADKAVELSQSTYSPIHQSALQRSTNGLARLFTMFSTMTTLYGNRQRAYWGAWQRGQISTTELVRQNFMETIMPPLTMTGFYAMVHGEWDDEDKEWGKDLTSDIAYWAMSGTPIVRDMLSVAGQASRLMTTRGRPEIQTPVLGHMTRIAQKSGHLFGEIMTGIFDPANAEDEAWPANAAIMLGELLSMTTGVPADRVSGKLLEGYRQVIEEDGGPLHILYPDPDKRRRGR